MKKVEFGMEIMNGIVNEDTFIILSILRYLKKSKQEVLDHVYEESFESLESPKRISHEHS